MSVISIITILVSYVDVLLPDAVRNYYDNTNRSIQWSSSMLVISFPVYLLTSWIIWREYRKHAVLKQSRVRKALIYLTLFIAAVTIIIDLITLVFRFYSGELTSAFAIKVLIVLCVSAAVFGYYLWELNKKKEKDSISKIVAWIVSGVVITTIVSGFFLIGSPATQRQKRFDDQRVSHLQEITNAVVRHWQHKQELPLTLTGLDDSISGFHAPVDPETESPYTYKVTGDLSFELCATFNTERTYDEYTPYPAQQRLIEPYPTHLKGTWTHTPGENCFERAIDPDMYQLERKI